MSEPDARKRCVRMEAGVWCMVTRLFATVHLNSLDLSARSHKLVTTEFIQLKPFVSKKTYTFEHHYIQLVCSWSLKLCS